MSTFATITADTQCVSPASSYDEGSSSNDSILFIKTVSGLCPQANYTFSVEVNDTKCPNLQSNPVVTNASTGK